MNYKSSKHNIERFLEFIHIPKNAGTTFENIANESNIKWGKFNREFNDLTDQYEIDLKLNEENIYNATELTVTSSDIRELIKGVCQDL
jgi:hypothetical protein